MVDKGEYWFRKKQGSCCHDNRKPVKKFFKIVNKRRLTTKCSLCRDYANEYNRKYRLNHLEKIKKQLMKWREDNPNYFKNYYRAMVRNNLK